MSNPIYWMSSTGDCPKLLTAVHLGYEFPPHSKASETIFREGKRHEDWVIEDLRQEGYEVETNDLCSKCDREGIHVELGTPLIDLMGHLDGRVKVNGSKLPLEVKSMGRFQFEKFRAKGFDAFPEYASQERCYLEVENSPGIYIVKCRDTGEKLRFSIGVELKGFKLLPLSLTYDNVLDKLNQVELWVREKTLPPIEYNEKSEQCRWCKGRHILCTVQQRNTEVILPNLIEASELWKEGKRLSDEGEEKLELAKLAFLQHSKENKLDRYSVGGLNVSYYGVRQRESIDEKLLKELVNEEIWRKALKRGKEWDDLRIRDTERK